MNSAPAIAVRNDIPARNNDDYPNIVKAAMCGGAMVGLCIGLTVKERSFTEALILTSGLSGVGLISGYTVYYGSLAVLDCVEAVVNRFRRN